MGESVQSTMGQLTSSDNFLLNGAAAWRNLTAVTVPPVNDTRGTLGCFTIASPAFGPSPKTKLMTPGGNPVDMY